MPLAYAGHRHRTKRSRDTPLLGLRGMMSILLSNIERFYMETTKKQG